MVDRGARSIRIAGETGSTNADLLNALRARDPVAEGEWLIADRQTAGRGRQGRRWFDGHGNYMGSTVVHLYPDDPPAHTLALLAGLCVRNAIAGIMPDRMGRLMLKWPNDVLLDDGKLAGILLEREGPSVVVGIGVNLVRAPQVEGRETTALAVHGIALERDDFARNLAKDFEQELRHWRTGGVEPLVRRWQAAAHPVGTPLQVHGADGELTSGQFEGLDAGGSLQLRDATGSVHTVHAGDVSLAPKD